MDLRCTLTVEPAGPTGRLAGARVAGREVREASLISLGGVTFESLRLFGGKCQGHG